VRQARYDPSDGNTGGTADLRSPRVDTIIILDLPRHRVLPTVARRTLRHPGREVQPDGGPEPRDLLFLR
jgi:hypothetical protein